VHDVEEQQLSLLENYTLPQIANREGKLAAIQHQVTGLHKMNAWSVKLNTLMKRQCTSICHQNILH
jgi:hypothetical protein